MSQRRIGLHLFLSFLFFIGIFFSMPYTVHAGTVTYNISYSGVSTNYSDGPLPYGLSYALDGEDIYCNLSVTNDTKITGTTLRIYRNGSQVYSYEHKAASGRYYRYIAFPYTISGAGDYKAYFDVVYDDGATQTLEKAFSVPSVSSSTSSISLDLYNKKSQTMTFTANYLPGCTYHFNISKGDSSIVSHSWGEWDGSSCPITFTGLKTGSTTATVSLVNASDNDRVMATRTITISVSDSTPKYTIRYDANGGSGAPGNQTKTYGVALTLSSSIPSRSAGSAGSYTVTLNANGGSVSQSTLTASRTTSYSFRNWNTSSNGSGTSYSPGGSYTVNAAATLYAQWNSSTTTASVNLPTPTRSGYNFKGWSTSTSASSGSTGSYTPSANVTLYAIWEGGYTVYFNANGGSVSTSSKSVTNGSTYGTLPTPTRSGYTFNGWYTSSSGGTQVTSSTSVNLSGNQTLYAHWTGNNYTVTFNANGGSVSMSSKTVTNGSTYGTLPTPTRTGYTFNGWYTSSSGGTQVTSSTTVNLSGSQTLYAHWTGSSYTVTFNANGGSVSTNSKTVTNGSTYGTLPTPTRSGYTFDGWYTSSSGGTQVTGSTTVNLSGNQTLYAHWTETYQISYDANGGTGTPSSQIKIKNVQLTLSSVKPYKEYTIRYNANGGSVSPASKSVECTFKNWNTKVDGSGSSYSSGGTYNENAGTTLYAQWTNPVAGTLAIPTRSGYVFSGWYTSTSGGTTITDSTTITGNMTVYAHWTDIYNMGDETYSFRNYSDSDSRGHCFGMASTSAGYHLNLLNIQRIGGNANTPLYSFDDTATVRLPICYYQGLQGKWAINATVAGGSYWSYNRANMASDWPSVVNYVSNHNYDDTGELLVTFWKKKPDGWSGHAVNFLRYENVNGQDRLYVYDNNNPTSETYFYRDSSGNVWETPYSTYGNASIDSIGLHDMREYFGNCNSFDPTHVLYTPATGCSVEGYSSTPLVGELNDEPYVMYEIPADQQQVIIIPNRDYADLIYMDTEYSFGEVTEGTYAVLKFASLNAMGDVVQGADFRIFDGDLVFGEPDFTLPESLTEIDISAFEGIAAEVVYVPDSCTSIGAYAFRYSSVKKIRIPAGCSIASTAFSGCEEVKIYGTTGSPAETFCITHSNCTFIPEAE